MGFHVERIRFFEINIRIQVKNMIFEQKSFDIVTKKNEKSCKIFFLIKKKKFFEEY